MVISWADGARIGASVYTELTGLSAHFARDAPKVRPTKESTLTRLPI